jgi:hypothetical protein
MKHKFNIYQTLKHLINEQTESESTPSDASNDETEKDGENSVFSPAEKRFLGTFDNAGASHIGIIYSLSDIGIREFIARSGKQYNCTPEILLSLLRDKFIKIVPYGGWGRDSNYTIELQISLDDIKGYGEESKKTLAAAAGGGAGGGGMDMSTPPPPPPTESPGPENAGILRYGTILSESAKFAKQILLEKKISNTLSSIHLEKSRMLKELPKEYLKDLNSVITHISKRSFSSAEKKKLIADILDNLSVNLKLTPKQIFDSYEMHKKQKKLDQVLNKK